ncbi:MAG: septum formation initiator [Bacteroidetes bacterium HGW-Bacteroidetes-21]|nr:MAG: septum formation initiator [Bacteroidetes bacterium HGW-Bacteroidetes-21]
MKKIKILSVLKNKYAITLVLFVVYVLIFSQNNLIERFSYIQELNKLERQKEYFKNEIIKNNEKLHLLKTNNRNLEKFAREQYLMKKDNEDVYVVVKKEEE